VSLASTSTIAFLVELVVVAAGGCTGGSHPPGQLIDGTRAEAPAVPLEAATPQILTKAAIVSTRHAHEGSAAERCLAALRDHRPSGPAVVRTGATGTSVTFRTASGRALVACDGTEATGASWCGHAYGRLERGRLLDPRLDLACVTTSGDPVAFAWFEPGPRASYVAVRQPGYVEVYRVAGGAPVRISTTTDISSEESSATFEVSEHDRGGALLRSSTFETRVAG
jgi:hypothetical protein